MRQLAVAAATLALCSCSSSSSDGAASSAAQHRDAGSSEGTSLFRNPDGGGFESRPIGLDAACAAETLKAERLPLDLYVMMDSSASMLQTLSDGHTKWDGIKTALSSFFADPQSADIGVGLAYFPKIVESAPRTCAADADCGAYGPCYGIKTCTTPYTQLCQAATDCASGQSCIPLGYCASTGKFCTPVGSACGAGDTCEGGVVEGYCLGRDACTAAEYASPAVAIAPLPGSAGALDTSLSAVTPDGYTPTSGALSGALDYARARTKSNPGRRVAVVLATDGLPTSCDPKDIAGVSALARQAYGESPSIRTFVIGVFASNELSAAANLGTIAEAGGTPKAYIVNTDQSVAKSFLDALDAIRTTALLCEYRIPTPKAPIDFGAVNVQITQASGELTTVPYVQQASQCSPTLGGWYYDAPMGGDPTTIITCDRTCDQLRSTTVGQVDIVMGCKTVTIR